MDLVLLVFGIASLPGLVVSGLLVDRTLRTMVYLAVALWGVTFGGMVGGVLLESAGADFRKSQRDTCSVTVRPGV
ncbi:hypothetical protein [Herminiimonas sp. KBW02]|uniref:hypothetical protein n=1 Tax=Herminiimonas sp. KBW02 TaxID=2153363 RepID=UPI000F591831|nr:hypothetical protein [Herminiimonas sp. KBW02]